MDCIIHGVVKSPTCVSNFHLLTRPLYLSPETLYEGQEATVRTGHGTTDLLKIGKGVWQGCMLSPCLFNFMQSTLWECQAGWVITWNQDCWEKCQQPQKGRWYHSNGRKWRGTKEPLDDSERGEWKRWLKIQHKNTLRSWPLVPSLHGK